MQLNTVVFAVVAAFCLFMFSGGPYLLNNVLNPRPVSALMNRYAVAAPLFGGFLFLGTFGLLTAYRNAKNRAKCALGFVYAVGSYASIEVLLFFIDPKHFAGVN